MLLKVEVDGRAPNIADLQEAAFSGYGHFTALQVRDGRTRGLALHGERLDAANRVLFGRPLAPELVRARVRHALTGVTSDASVRVMVRGAEYGASTRLWVTLRPPFVMPDSPQRLCTVQYQRTAAWIKRPGDFGQLYHGDQAQRAGFDDALLVDHDGTVSETTVANVAFFDGDAVIWPQAPVLPGVTMQLVAPRLAEYGLHSRTAQVTVGDLPSFAGACVTNSRGIAPVSRIDEVEIPQAQVFLKAMRDAYDAVPWDDI